jgi:LytS/YehU family sensor histidine kinase
VVADFLALEAMRLGSRLRVTWDWDPALDSLELPPLLVQPLVENAIKHGISPSLTGGDLLIRLRAEAQDLCLEVWNTGAPLRPGPTQGLGIRNLAARLHLSCGPAATLNLGPHQEGTLASIRLPGALVKFSHETSTHAGGG